MAKNLGIFVAKIEDMMKNFLLSLLVIVGACVAVDVFASCTSSDDTDRVKAFYQQYAQAWCLTDRSQSVHQCDSLMSVYCTPALCQEAINDPIGYDYATDDAGMDEMSLQTLQVSKDGTDYKVSYKTNFKNDRYEKTIVQVNLKVVLENGKISKVTKMQ